MDKFGPTLIIVIIVIIVLGAMWFGWRRRGRRDAALQPIEAVPRDVGPVLARVATFYVATTEHDKPLERLAIRGLSFGGRAQVTISHAGAVLEVTGEKPVFVPASALIAVDTSTVTIDRVVEPGGLVRFDWHINSAGRVGMGPVVDSYLRVIDPTDRGRLLEAFRTIVPADAGSAESEV